MAKMKTFAIDVEIVVKRTLYVDARRPNGAVEKLSTREGWAEATRYQDDPVLDSLFQAPKDMTVVKTREV